MMNDKIKELIKKATVSYPSHGAFGEYEESEVLEGELLVKLVVEECYKIVEASKVGFSQVPAEVALDLTAKNINSYFGIKDA